MKLQTEVDGVNPHRHITGTITADHEVLLHRVDADKPDVADRSITADPFYPFRIQFFIDTCFSGINISAQFKTGLFAYFFGDLFIKQPIR